MGNKISSDMIGFYHSWEVATALTVMIGILVVFSVTPVVVIAIVLKCDNDPIRRNLGDLYYDFWRNCVTNILKFAVKTNENDEEDVLFAGIEPDGEIKYCRCCTPTSCGITYFVFILFWALVWLWVIFWDNVLYSKLTRCIDINPEDDAITCFFINNNSRAHCADISRNRQNADVICYALNRGQALNAIGIAFSVSQIVIFGAQMCFIVILRTCHWLDDQGWGKGCWCTLQIVVLGIAAVVSLVLWPALSVEIGGTDGNNFFYGMEPLRWTEYALVCCTLASALIVPTCALI